MKKVLLMLVFTIIFGCSNDDEYGTSDYTICGSLTIYEISKNSNKVKIEAYGNEEEVSLPEGKTYSDFTCDKTLEWFGVEAD